jgi:endonuclease YncB( thermonuclease family)
MITRMLSRIGRIALMSCSLVMPSNLSHAGDCRIDVIDGDTVRTCEGRVRLRTCNAPERFMAGGQAASKRLDALLLDAAWIEVACHRDRTCRDILNRQICDVFVDGENVCNVLVAEGYAERQRALRTCQMQRPHERTPVVRWGPSRRL